MSESETKLTYPEALSVAKESAFGKKADAISCNAKWNERNVEGRLELLRQELRDLSRILHFTAASVRIARLQVQNHEHSDANGRALFPAAVFEPDTTNPPGYKYDPLA